MHLALKLPDITEPCQRVLNFFFPSFCLGCGHYLEWKADKKELCGDCDYKLKKSWRDARHVFDGFKHLERLYVFGPYREEPLTTLIHKTKYENKEWALGPIFKELPHFASQQELPSFIDRVIPIPLHQSRLRQRGFNQAELIAREMARILNKPLMTKTLARHRPTKPQTEMKLDKERAQNIKDAFSLNPAGQSIDLKGQKILLVDDVATTGATLQECAKPLKKLGAHVYGFALAR